MRLRYRDIQEVIGQHRGFWEEREMGAQVLSLSQTWEIVRVSEFVRAWIKLQRSERELENK